MISLCIITKDNEKHIANCINSVKKLVDEIIVVDTGSSDKTAEIATGLRAKVSFFKWNDNFSEAKNFAKSLATKDWILNLDADETISEKDSEKIKKLTELDFLGFSFLQRNYQNKTGLFSSISCTDDEYEESKSSVCFVPRRIVRFFKNLPEINFEGVIHDSVEPSILKIGKVLETEIPIHHFGMLNRSDDRTRMYIDIEKKNLRGDYFQDYQIGCQLSSIGELDEALDFLDKSLEKNTDFELAWLEKGIIYLRQNKLYDSEYCLKRAENSGHEMVFSHLGIVYAMMQDFDLSYKNFAKALEINPKNADTYYNLGLLFLSAGDKNQAKQVMDRAVYLNRLYKERVQDLFKL